MVRAVGNGPLRESDLSATAWAPVRPIDPTVGFLASPDLASLTWPACRTSKHSAWQGHVSFAHWLVGAVRPRVVVELGTHAGVSFAAFCNAVRLSGQGGRVFAVDTWRGDSHSGFYEEDIYHDLLAFTREQFPGVGTLMRCLFDEALAQFPDGCVDLLHIDGLHTYEAVRHDFDTWRPKLSARAVVLFHDTDIRGGDFGVWRVWEELAPQFPSFRFTHAAGLGVLAVGPAVPPAVAALCAVTAPEQVEAIRGNFSVFSDFAVRNSMTLAREKAERAAGALGRNIALHCHAAQSSVDMVEFASAGRACNGIKTGLFAFHTKLEPNPWWMVDLGTVQRFDNILVYNRLDGPCAPRARTLRVLVSDDAAAWAELYAHNGTTFGGADGQPLHIACAGAQGRFVRLQLAETNFLHLDEVEIYAPKPG
jgi:Methyltransferase domain/NedA-like, galactose-binding domain